MPDSLGLFDQERLNLLSDAGVVRITWQIHETVHKMVIFITVHEDTHNVAFLDFMDTLNHPRQFGLCCQEQQFPWHDFNEPRDLSSLVTLACHALVLVDARDSLADPRYVFWLLGVDVGREQTDQTM